MGVYIKGMEVPKDGDKVYMVTFSDGKACVSDKPFEWHEVVHVPPHGRLIDADAVFKRLQKQAMSVWGNGNPRYQIVLEVMDAIRFAPIIIPAEEGE